MRSAELVSTRHGFLMKSPEFWDFKPKAHPSKMAERKSSRRKNERTWGNFQKLQCLGHSMATRPPEDFTIFASAAALLNRRMAYLTLPQIRSLVSALPEAQFSRCQAEPPVHGTLIHNNMG